MEHTETMRVISLLVKEIREYFLQELKMNLRHE